MLLQELQQCQMQDAYVWEYDITDDQDLGAERHKTSLQEKKHKRKY